MVFKHFNYLVDFILFSDLACVTHDRETFLLKLLFLRLLLQTISQLNQCLALFVRPLFRVCVVKFQVPLLSSLSYVFLNGGETSRLQAFFKLGLNFVLLQPGLCMSDQKFNIFIFKILEYLLDLISLLFQRSIQAGDSCCYLLDR